jgi:hypothetical protein
LGLRLRRLGLKYQMVAALRDGHHNQIVGSLARVVFGEFEAQPFGLDPNARVGLGVEIGAAAIDLPGDLIFLQQFVGTFEGLFCAILQQPGEGF